MLGIVSLLGSVSVFVLRMYIYVLCCFEFGAPKGPALLVHSLPLRNEKRLARYIIGTL